MKKPKLTIISSAADMDDIELGNMIRDRFNCMDNLVEMVVRGHEDKLIISGATGVGKSFKLEKRMKEARENGEVNKFTQKKGTMSALGLYKEIYNHRMVGDVLLLDDIDVFDSERKLDVLKSVMDTGDDKVVSWASTTAELSKDNIPTSFNFEGSLVFITNKDFDDLILKDNELTPHLKAMMGRASYLDLCVHSNKAILIRIKQLLNETNMAQYHSITPQEEKSIVDWLEGNQEQLRELSIRTVLKLAKYMHGCHDWESIAEMTLLKNSNI